MKRHYSPNHPAVRSRQSNYHTAYLEPSITERRNAVKRRVNSRKNARLVAVSFWLPFGVAILIAEKHPIFAIGSMLVALAYFKPYLKQVEQ